MADVPTPLDYLAIAAALRGRQPGAGMGLTAPFPPASALDTSGMGAMVPPDTWLGRMNEATGGDIRNPQDRQRMIDFAGGIVGPSVLGTAKVAQGIRAAPLAIKDAIEASAPQEDMVRLYRGGGNNPGGPKWVTTDRRFAERYTTPGLAHTEGPGSYLQYVDVPKSDPRVQIPPGQSVHSFEAGPDIAGGLQPFYSAQSANLPTQIGTEFAGHTGRVMLADVHAAFPEVPRPQLEGALRQMQAGGKLSLMRLDNPREITARDQAAAMQIGNEPRHMFRWLGGK